MENWRASLAEAFVIVHQQIFGQAKWYFSWKPCMLYNILFSLMPANRKVGEFEVFLVSDSNRDRNFVLLAFWIIVHRCIYKCVITLWKPNLVETFIYSSLLITKQILSTNWNLYAQTGEYKTFTIYILSPSTGACWGEIWKAKVSGACCFAAQKAAWAAARRRPLPVQLAMRHAWRYISMCQAHSTYNMSSTWLETRMEILWQIAASSKSLNYIFKALLYLRTWVLICMAAVWLELEFVAVTDKSYILFLQMSCFPRCYYQEQYYFLQLVLWEMV